MRTCKIEGCENKHEALGYCSKHRMRFKRHGDPLYTKTEKHGMARTSEYTTWQCVIKRCYNRKCKDYKRYGNRGITVCDRWRNSFLVFYADMGPKPFPKAQIDRIDNDGNYEPGNCRWTTCAVNSQNGSRTKLTMPKVEEIRKIYKAGGITRKEIGILYGVSPQLIRHVVNNKTWI